MKTKLLATVLLAACIYSCDKNEWEVVGEAQTIYSAEASTVCIYHGVAADLHVNATHYDGVTNASVTLSAASETIDHVRVTNERQSIDTTVSLPYAQIFHHPGLTINEEYEYTLSWQNGDEMRNLHLDYTVTWKNSNLSVDVFSSNDK